MKIPGLSFSWKRALGITKAKRKIAKATGIPTTKQGRRNKTGKMFRIKQHSLFCVEHTPDRMIRGVSCFRIEFILAPTGRVGVDVFRGRAVILLTANNVVVIGPLPEGKPALPVGCAFQIRYDSGYSRICRGRRPRRPNLRYTYQQMDMVRHDHVFIN